MNVTSTVSKWAKVIDQTRCIGCHACSTACKSENEVPLSVNRTYVKYVDVGNFPNNRRAFQVTRCNQCEFAPCVEACPTKAMYRRDDGIVDFDKSRCIGCKACIAACPYDAIFMNPEDHSAEKCNLCAHRLDIGLEPACVVVCPTQAILVGDLDDPNSKVAQIVQREPVTVRRPEKETHPKLFYLGATQATLDPIAADRPTGGLFVWSEQSKGSQAVVSGHPTGGNSSAAALLSYDVPHKAPWDWRVSLYTWTKSISAGVYLLAAVFVLLGMLDATGQLWTTIVPVIALTALAVTGGLLVWDLEQPKRFYYILTKPQWKSWLVRGGVIIGLYGAILVGHIGAGFVGMDQVRQTLIPIGIPVAAMTAVYTAYLFAQSKGRDLWQSPLLPPHMLVQAVLAGSAVLAIVAVMAAPAVVESLYIVVAVASATHVLFVLGEITLPHGTAQTRFAVQQMTHGKYKAFFWSSLVFGVIAVAAPWLGVFAAGAGLIGLLLFEHAYVQAGQSVPLA